MAKTPFKMRGWSPFTKTSPAKDTNPHTGSGGHEHEKSQAEEEEEKKPVWKETSSEKVTPGSEMAKEGYTLKITYTNQFGGTKIGYA